MASATRQTTLREAIADDHQLMYNLYNAYVSNTGNLKEQSKWSNQLVWEIARHATGEEIVVYPLFEKHLGEEGKQMADHDRSDHQQVKNSLSELENLQPGSSEHASLLKTIMETLRSHNESEEQNDLPALEKAMGSQASISSANKFKRTKHFVPTRMSLLYRTLLPQTRAHILQRSVVRSTVSPSLYTLRTMATSKQTITHAIIEDHREMYAFYDEYVKHEGNPEAQSKWARQLIWEVARHAVGEELVVYPLMEKHLGAEGLRLASEDREDHQKVKEMLYNIENLTPGTEEYSALLKSVMDHLRPHNDSEEQKDLPLLEKAIGSEASASAASSFKRTKKFVPTRSHPSAPNKPPFETLAGLMAAPIDLLKDTFAKFPSDEELSISFTIVNSSSNTDTDNMILGRSFPSAGGRGVNFLRASILPNRMGSQAGQLQTPQLVRALATQSPTLSEAIKAEHHAIGVFADEYARSRGNKDAQERWANQLQWTVARHAVGEELVVYPLLEQFYGDRGLEIANEDRADHQEVKEILYDMGSLSPGTPRFDAALSTMMKHLRTHMDYEETDDLPLLEQALGEENSKETAKNFEKTKKLAPTRPHPAAPDRPPYENLAGFLAMPIDKLRDQFTKFPTEEMMEEVVNDNRGY
ncbi:hypothetical protein CVT24_010746 [Panaeolus cyanescens]|uniref:Hemerythrin-like domain-containing protein n=1 Tax=Panaeolus cyanescens TaxID=181874 RepID=A0A409YMF5_9AGAR|nr:hypothetical protein CVT24_010746 [Panaeolus cyanescens]